MELARSGIRVNVVSPGVISTPGSEEFSKTTPGFSPDDWLRSIPLGHIGATEDIAEVVALLVSDRGKFLTDVNYRADGGMIALTNVRFQHGSVNRSSFPSTVKKESSGMSRVLDRILG